MLYQKRMALGTHGNSKSSKTSWETTKRPRHHARRVYGELSGPFTKGLAVVHGGTIAECRCDCAYMSQARSRDSCRASACWQEWWQEKVRNKDMEWCRTRCQHSPAGWVAMALFPPR